ncbi:MAG TPA: hypothetical protein QF772_01635, partial [Nitrospinaceae bacterium]|nr:hypothetical protein [Nitrospinaceae bacterium]
LLIRLGCNSFREAGYFSSGDTVCHGYGHFFIPGILLAPWKDSRDHYQTASEGDASLWDRKSR